jgi:hypothetical protein
MGNAIGLSSGLAAANYVGTLPTVQKFAMACAQLIVLALKIHQQRQIISICA